MSRYTLVRAKNASKTVGLYVDGERVCTHDRTCRKQDVELSIYQHFGENEYTEKVADRPGALPKRLDPEPSAEELREREAAATDEKAEEPKAEEPKAEEPKARPQKQGKK